MKLGWYSELTPPERRTFWACFGDPTEPKPRPPPRQKPRPPYALASIAAMVLTETSGTDLHADALSGRLS